MKKTLYILLFATTIVLGCKAPISGYYSYETECLGKNFDGTQTVKTWGTGEDKKSARENAYQQALNDILFKGIRNGSPDCEVRPLVTEVNALEKHRNYFQHFFSRRGNYTRFITLTKGNKVQLNARSNFKEAYAYVIEVDIPGLRNQLQQDQIIP